MSDQIMFSGKLGPGGNETVNEGYLESDSMPRGWKHKPLLGQTMSIIK